LHTALKRPALVDLFDRQLSSMPLIDAEDREVSRSVLKQSNLMDGFSAACTRVYGKLVTAVAAPATIIFLRKLRRDSPSVSRCSNSDPALPLYWPVDPASQSHCFEFMFWLRLMNKVTCKPAGLGS
jgi:hypothetical protein